MARKKATTYTLRVIYGMSHATVQRLQANLPVSTHTLDKLCKIFNCQIEEIVEYVPDGELYPPDIILPGPGASL